MPRRIVAWFIHLATFGKCSLIFTPAALVGIALNSLAPLPSVLISKVSLWLGPPSIHMRMQRLAFALGLVVAPAAWAARTFIHPEKEAPNTPAAESFRKSRRVFSERV